MKSIAIIMMLAVALLLLKAAIYLFVFNHMTEHYKNTIDKNEQENIEYMKTLRGPT